MRIYVKGTITRDVDRVPGIQANFKIINSKRLHQVEILMGRSHLFLDLMSKLTTLPYPVWASLLPLWRSPKHNQMVEFGLNACKLDKWVNG